jgi:hypothetical protein
MIELVGCVAVWSLAWFALGYNIGVWREHCRALDIFAPRDDR